MMTPKWTGFPYFEAAAKGGEDAAKELGDEFVYAGADHADVTLQVETLQNFLTQKPDAIVLAAIDLNAVAPVLKEAREQGIVVTTFDADAAADARDMFVNQMSYKQAAKTMLDCALMDAPEGGEVAFVAASPTVAEPHGAHQVHEGVHRRTTRSTRSSRWSTPSTPTTTTPRATTSPST